MNFQAPATTLKEALEQAYTVLSTLPFVSPAKLLADIIGNVLADVTYGDNLFIGSMPDKPDLSFCFYDTGGGAQEPDIAIDTSKVQLTGRGSYEECFLLMTDLKIVLQSIPPMVLFKYNLVGVWVTSSMGGLGKDDTNRFMFSINFRVTVEPNNKGSRDTGINPEFIENFALATNDW